MNDLEEFGKGKILELEAKLSRMILYVEIAVFIAVATVGLLLENWLLGSISSLEIGFALLIAVFAAYLTGSQFWRIYREIEASAIKFVDEQRKKISGH